jgi:outer membrane immunogenic protein
MRKITMKLLTAACIMAVPGVAAAQDWNGFYGGLTFGYSVGDANHSFNNGAPSGNSSPDGILGGVFAGYGIQSGNLVYGAEADIDLNNASGSFTNTTGATSAGTTDGVWQGSVRGVLGVAGQFTGKPTLFYATAGWAIGEFDFMGGPSAAGTNPYSDTLNGWTIGAGMNVRLTDMTALRLEYRYTDFGTASGVLAPAFPAVTMPVDVTQHAFRVGIRMDF